MFRVEFLDKHLLLPFKRLAERCRQILLISQDDRDMEHTTGKCFATLNLVSSVSLCSHWCLLTRSADVTCCSDDAISEV